MTIAGEVCNIEIILRDEKIKKDPVAGIGKGKWELRGVWLRESLDKICNIWSPSLTQVLSVVTGGLPLPIPS